MGLFLKGTENLKTGSSVCKNGLDLFTGQLNSRDLLPFVSYRPRTPSDPVVFPYLNEVTAPADLL